MPRTILIIPCYNEEKRLDTEAFRTFESAAGQVDFCFVDDGSTDGTRQILRSMVAARKGSFLVEAPRNGGKPEAVRLGMLRATAEEPDFVGFWDADLATPLAELDGFVNVLTRQPHLSVVYGARVRLVGRFIERQAKRHYLGRFGATLISLALGFPIYDTQCGAKLFRAIPAVRRVFAEPFTTRWIFDVEILARWRQLERLGEAPPLKDALYELPLTTWRDVKGSKVRSTDYLRSLRDLWSIYRRYGTSGARQIRS